MEEQQSNVYKVTVNTGGSIDFFKTHQSDIFRNVMDGNEPMIYFKTIDNKTVCVPTRFMVIHELVDSL